MTPFRTLAWLALATAFAVGYLVILREGDVQREMTTETTGER